MKRMMRMAVLLMGAALTACGDTEGIVPTERSGIDVSTTTIEMSEMTRAAVTGKADRLVWVLKDADGAVTSGVQTSGLDALAIDCAAGTYALTVLANMGDVPTIGEDGRMTFGKVGNAYALRREVTVERGQRTSLSMELKRVVARLKLTSTDAVPSTVKKVKMKVTGVSNTMDAETCRGTEAETYETAVVDASGVTKEGKLSLTTYHLLPAESVTDVTVMLTCYDATDAVLLTRTWTEIPMAVNRQTTMTAACFHDHGADAALTVSDVWGEEISVLK